MREPKEPWPEGPCRFDRCGTNLLENETMTTITLAKLSEAVGPDPPTDAGRRNRDYGEQPARAKLVVTPVVRQRPGPGLCKG